MEDLNDRDRQVVIMRYGLADNEPKTLGEVAEILGLSRERVRQIEERAVSTLRKEAQKAGILEMSAIDYRTRKLHSAMQPRVKTNILGETEGSTFLAKLIKSQKAAVRAARRAEAKKKAAKAAKLAAKQEGKPLNKAAKKAGTKKAAPKKTAPKKAVKKTVTKKKVSKAVSKKSAKK